MFLIRKVGIAWPEKITARNDKMLDGFCYFYDFIFDIILTFTTHCQPWSMTYHLAYIIGTNKNLCPVRLTSTTVTTQPSIILNLTLTILRSLHATWLVLWYQRLHVPRATCPHSKYLTQLSHLFSCFVSFSF